MWTGYAPSGMTAVGVGEELKGTPAGVAFEVMFNEISRPFRIEEVLESAGAFGKDKPALTHQADQPAGKFKVFPGVVEAPAFHEPVALWAGCHLDQ